MNLVDIHAHLDHTKFSKDLDKVIERARKSGLKTIITSGVNSTTNRIILKIQEKYPDIVKISFGIYPLDALAKELEIGEASGFARQDENRNNERGRELDGFVRDIEQFDLDSELKFIQNNKDKCIAIGECGLDYNWTQEEKIKQEQKKIFQKIINLAIKLNKPLIVHSRKAEIDALDMLEKSNYKKVVLHCFSGRTSLIKKGVDLGYYFSIPPIITRLQHFQLLATIVPLSQLLTETDAPYLSPVQGERNTPANVKVTIKEIAKIKNLPEKKVAEAIWQNYKKLFEK